MVLVSVVAMATVLLLSLFIIVIVQFFTIAPLKREKARLQAEYERIQANKEYLTNAKDYITSNEFLEEWARNKGLGKAGSIKYGPK